MSVANRLTNFLTVSQTEYRLVPHRHSHTAADSAQAAHIPMKRVVKSVLLRDRGNGRYLMALTPACNQVDLGGVRDGVATDPVLASEAELGDVFRDCELGAVPGFGQAYHMDMVWDDELSQHESLFFEAGDHESLIEIEHDDFLRLFDGFPHASISKPSESFEAYSPWEF
ncbi:MAG: YbaK/EbsC family protein [Halioglobus sp.]